MATQRVLSLSAFAQAMLDTDDAFARRVRAFEAQHGRADVDTLAVMAQASYYCWFAVEYECDYLGVCRAIGTGSPTGLHLCRQVTPARWAEMHTYVIAVQRWLGSGLCAPGEVDEGKVTQLLAWLGEHSPVKTCLAHLFLSNLIADLLHLSLSQLGEGSVLAEREYLDYSPWYVGQDGTCYATKDPASLLDGLKRRVRLQMRGAAEDGEELIAGILKESQPACQHRFSRYQDIKVSSIGAQRWRGNVPPDDEVPKGEAATWYERASLQGWLEGLPPEGAVQATLHAALGDSTERKQALVRDFFLRGPPGDGFWDWLNVQSRERGFTARAAFGFDT
jgi:hypothetical protein